MPPPRRGMQLTLPIVIIFLILLVPHVILHTTLQSLSLILYTSDPARIHRYFKPPLNTCAKHTNPFDTRTQSLDVSLLSTAKDCAAYPPPVPLPPPNHVHQIIGSVFEHINYSKVRSLPPPQPYNNSNSHPPPP